jgi:hypothetical protein
MDRRQTEAGRQLAEGRRQPAASGRQLAAIDQRQAENDY